MCRNADSNAREAGGSTHLIHDLTGLTGRAELVRWSSFSRHADRPPACMIAIPARNEAERVVSCLDACRAALAAARLPAGILLLVNNSTDATAFLASEWALGTAVPLELVEVILPPARAHAGAARRLALDLARRALAPGDALLTTDADSRPERGWVVANLRELAQGAALVCGRVEPDAGEQALLPAALTVRDAMEERYFMASLELASLLDPDPFNPWPHHGRASGASLAMTAGTYDRIGGAPIVACGEDRALARHVRAHDLPVVYSSDARVITSCRLDGRAPGGMADTMRRRLAAADHACDELLEPARRLFLQADSRGRARRLWCRDLSPDRLLEQLGLDVAQRRQAALHRGFGRFWAFVEEQSPGLARQRLQASEVAAQLPQLTALLATARRRRRPVLEPGIAMADAGPILASQVLAGEPAC